MDKRVAVEDSLHEYIEFLENSGYEVDKISNSAATNVQSFNYDAVVVSNMDEGSMGKADNFRTGSPVVEANGKTPEEVFNILRGRY